MTPLQLKGLILYCKEPSIKNGTVYPINGGITGLYFFFPVVLRRVALGYEFYLQGKLKRVTI